MYRDETGAESSLTMTLRTSMNKRRPIRTCLTRRVHAGLPAKRVRSTSLPTQIKATPQLFAFGMANFVGSMFCSLPGAASLSRGEPFGAGSRRETSRSLLP